MKIACTMTSESVPDEGSSKSVAEEKLPADVSSSSCCHDGAASDQIVQGDNTNITQQLQQTHSDVLPCKSVHHVTLAQKLPPKRHRAGFAAAFLSMPVECQLCVLSWIDPRSIRIILESSSELRSRASASWSYLSKMLMTNQFFTESRIFPSSYIDHVDCLIGTCNPESPLSVDVQSSLRYLETLQRIETLTIRATHAIQIGIPLMRQTDMIINQITCLWRFIGPFAARDGGSRRCFEDIDDATYFELSNFLENLVSGFLINHDFTYPSCCRCMHARPARRPRCTWRFPARLAEEMTCLGLPEVLTNQYLLSRLSVLLDKLWNDGDEMTPCLRAELLHFFCADSSAPSQQKPPSEVSPFSTHPAAVEIYMHRCMHNPDAPLRFRIAAEGETYEVIVWGKRGAGLVELAIDENLDYCGMLEGRTELGARGSGRFEYWNMWNFEESFELGRLFGT